MGRAMKAGEFTAMATKFKLKHFRQKEHVKL
jgi:hypothetical protein